MFDYNPTQAEFDDAMQALQSAGVATVTVEFSGGNDEGGADGIEYLDADGTAVTTVPKGYAYNESGYSYDQVTKQFTANEPRWVVYEGHTADGKRDATDDEVRWGMVAKVLEYPIYERWGSFAGEFHVYGTLRWDVAAGTYKLSGQESVEHYDDFSEEG